MNMSKMNDDERRAGLFCTPPHIVKALLKREIFLGSILDPAAGKGDIVKVLLACGHHNIMAADKHDWGYRPCRIEDFLTSTTNADNIVMNAPFHLDDCRSIKFKFLAQAKRLARRKIAALFPVSFELTIGFIRHHERDLDFPLKAIYVFPQTIRWLNNSNHGGKMRFAWFVFERGYTGPVRRKTVIFRKNPSLSHTGG
jgi:hypothetical protein